MKKFLKYLFIVGMVVYGIGITIPQYQFLSSMVFGISFLGWLCIVTDKGSRRIDL